jgi:hypothetical protein
MSIYRFREVLKAQVNNIWLLSLGLGVGVENKRTSGENEVLLENLEANI